MMQKCIIMLEWLGSRYVELRATFLIYGHIHAMSGQEVHGNIKEYQPNALDACVDINGYEAVAVEELKKNNEEWHNRRHN